MIGCDKAIAVAVVLAVNFDVSPLSAVTCSQLDFTELTNSTNNRIALLGRLVEQAGRRLASCGAPSAICSDMACSLMQLLLDCHVTLVCRVEG